MIVVPLVGGLGNQLFQYAFLRASSLMLDRSPVMDLTGFPTGQGRHRRSFQLRYVKRPRGLLTLGPESEPGSQLVRSLVRTGGKRLASALNRWTVREDARHDVLVDLREIPARIARCEGYWQSHRYFADVAGTIRSELTPAVHSGGRVAQLLRRVEDRETICVHVRRGDYVAVERVRAVHGVVDEGYYESGVARAAEGLRGSPLVLVLTDDPQWAMRHLSFDIETVHVESTAPLSAVESLALMSRAQHHVISNSTFSWWGAWLAEHPRQRVYYPRRWFAGREVDIAFRFPARWQALET